MIGVVAKPTERRVAEEFFELFKTPWEFYSPNRTYDVVLSTVSPPEGVEARLVVTYGSQSEPADAPSEKDSSKQLALSVSGKAAPLYGEARIFKGTKADTQHVTLDGRCVGYTLSDEQSTSARIGYDLFFEIEQLLKVGQPLEHAESPTLELHIELLRTLILKAGLPLVEIPPTPANYDFAVCLTHDIDFVGIRCHKFDHTMWGFVLRATVGSLRDFLRGRTPGARLLASWKAAASLPFVYLGLAEDFWMPFDWYLKVEENLSPTYFFIPFKGIQGEKVNAENPARRASGYDIGDIPDWIAKLKAAGCEVGVHGLDAWHDAERGRAERKRVSEVSGEEAVGIRMHWLLRDQSTCEVLERAGYGYDSTAGYNEKPGYRCGTLQAFRPLTTERLLELPLHIQDGALFYAKRSDLTEAQAWEKCETFIQNGLAYGGVLTVLWHDRSFAAERFWGDFYVRLVARLKGLNVWFSTASDLVSWFRERREITFECDTTSSDANGVRIRKKGKAMSPAFRVRLHRPAISSQKSTTVAAWQTSDAEWNGGREICVNLASGRHAGDRAELLQTTVSE
jgi:hypothetical protein